MSDRLLYDGQWLHWLPAAKGTARKYAATSGLPSFQNTAHQCVPDSGPIPAGTYVFQVALAKGKYAKDDGTGHCKLLPAWKIEQIPRGPAAGECEQYWSNWGHNRVRIEPASEATRRACAVRRSGFYIHDSTKGFSHGCIEVDPAFFDRLVRYAQGLRGAATMFIDVRYVYASTYGFTRR